MTNLASTAKLVQVLQQYLDQFPSERSSLYSNTTKEHSTLSLGHFLATTSSEDLYNRKNFNGHLTASAFILSADGQSVLLLQHRSLNRWLQPGGHIDATDSSILEAAYREVVEETGIPKENLKLLPFGSSSNMPFDIDSHLIPANPKKNEEAHVHHDFRFLLQIKQEASVQISAQESNDYRWVSLEELKTTEDHAKVAEKIVQLTSL